MKNIDYSLYLVTNNKNETEQNFLNIIEEAIKGGASIIQLREKDLPLTSFFELAKKVKSITDNYNVPLIINDKVAIAIGIESRGVHIGQDDLPAKEVRKAIGENMILGVSVSTVKEAEQAEADGADYLGTGAVFPTFSKENAPTITKEDVKNIVKSVNIPVVAIGGIGIKNVKELKDTGIEGISVISAIMESENPKIASELLKEEFNKIK